MKTLRTVLPLIILLSLSLSAFAQGPGGGGGGGNNGFGGGGSGTTLDGAEKVHLLFMRAEEKLAHDVYEALGIEFPDYAVFSNIMASETNHVASMVDKLNQYLIDDPNADDVSGEFANENYGEYFSTKYNALIDVAKFKKPLLQALKNGALIEELDMHDIVRCPEVIVDAVDNITDEFGCGMEYTDEKVLISSYENLLDGSKNHLRAFVRVIETTFPEEYPYQAQYLSLDEVDEILGR